MPTVVCPDQSTTVHADEVTQSVQQDGATQSVQQDSTTQSVQQDSTTQSVQQDDATQSVQQDSTTQSVQQDSATQSVQQDNKNQSVQQDSTTQSVQQDNSNQTAQQVVYEDWRESDGIDNTTHYTFTDSPTYTICGNAIWDSERELLLGVTNEDPTTNAPEGYVLNESYKYNGKYMNIEIPKDSILADWSRYASYRMYFFTKVAPSTDTPSVDPKQDEPTIGKETDYGYEKFYKDYDGKDDDGTHSKYFYSADPSWTTYQEGKIWYKPSGQDSPILYGVIPNGWELDSSNPMNNNFINYYGTFTFLGYHSRYSLFTAKVQFIRPIADTPSRGQDTPAPSRGQDQPVLDKIVDTPAFGISVTNCYDSSKVTPDQIRGYLSDPGFIQQNNNEDYTAPAGYEEDPTVKGGYVNHDDGIFIPNSIAIRFYRPITTPAPTTPDTPSRGTDTPNRGSDTPNRGSDTPNRGADTPSRGSDIPNSQTEGTSRNVNTTPVVAEGQIKTIKKTVKPIEKPSSMAYGNSSYVAPTSIKKDSLATQSLDNKQNDDKSSLPSTGETNTLSTLLSLSGITLLLSLFGIKAYRKN